MTSLGRAFTLSLVLLATAGCDGFVGILRKKPEPPTLPTQSRAVVPIGLRVLTVSQHHNALRGLLGDGLPPRRVGEWVTSLEASQGGVSSQQVEDYESATLEATQAAFSDAATRDALVGCRLRGAVEGVEDPCATAFFTRFGRRAWRRPLTEAEVSRHVQLARAAAVATRDTWKGLSYAVAALLQSPHFLYRIELSEGGALSAYELASRLSFFLWNAGPDDALLDAAARGDLSRRAPLRAQVQRMLEAPQAREGLQHFFADVLDLDALESLRKSAATFPTFDHALALSMKEQLLRTVDDLLWVRGGDYRDLLTTRDTFVDAPLAALYGLPDPGPGFHPVTLPADGPRKGLLGFAGVLALQASAASTSPTLRGRYIRTALLCENVPPPPPGVNSSLPPLGAEPKTTRQRLEAHAAGSCASCHQVLDPLGFPLETFDAIGGYRTHEGNLPIDASGALDGTRFSDAKGLADALGAHPKLTPCLVRKAVRYAMGRTEGADEEPLIAALTTRFEAQGNRLRPLLEAVATDPAFTGVEAE